jgi:AcrR family transcriptional regulator
MPGERRGRSAEGRAEVRRDLVTAAVDLFTARGYEATTVDDITAAAGVARRTFFRYFRSKEDAVSPDHEAGMARVAEVFAGAHPAEPAPALVLRAGETVFDLYTDDPALSVRRFALVHQVPALRDRESAGVDHYRRLFTRRLRARLRDDLRAAVAGAGIVAAHNVALREWLAAGGDPAGIAAMVGRFREVAGLLPLEAGLVSVAERLEAVAARLDGLQQGGA